MSRTGVSVKLLGEDSNAFAIIGKVVRAMKLAKIGQDTIDEYRQDAMNGDYDHLLRVTMEYVDVE